MEVKKTSSVSILIQLKGKNHFQLIFFLFSVIPMSEALFPGVESTTYCLFITKSIIWVYG